VDTRAVNTALSVDQSRFETLIGLPPYRNFDAAFHGYDRWRCWSCR
jgi:hypothetical protein